MLPGFGAPESKAFLTLFKRCAESVGTRILQDPLNAQRRRDPTDEQQMDGHNQ